MSTSHRLLKSFALAALIAAATALSAIGPSAVAQTNKPNILFIMGDDIGWMQPSIYHRGLWSEKRPTSIASARKVRSS